MKKQFLIIGMLMATVAVFAQNKPVRIGVKLGMPNLAGLNGEYVTPLVNGRLGVGLDLTYIPLGFNYSDPSGASVSGKFALSYWGLEPHFYFGKNPGKGPYLAAGFGRMGLKATATGATSSDGLSFDGEVSGKYGINFVQFKLGWKWGGLFYFRPELGYGLAQGDDKMKVDVEYSDGKKESDDADVPGVAGGGIVLNIGFGFAF